MTNVLPVHENLDPEPDALAIFLEVVRAVRPDISPSEADQIGKKLQSKLGGRRFYFPKTARRITPQQRAELYQVGLTNLTDTEIVEKHKISKTTLWRIMKSGGGRFS